MSDSTNTGGFAKAFLPGLILGLVIGAFVGATLPALMAKRPMDRGTPGTVTASGAREDRSSEDRTEGEDSGLGELAGDSASADAETGETGTQDTGDADPGTDETGDTQDGQADPDGDESGQGDGSGG